MKACSPLMGVRSISDRQQMLKKGAGMFILALFCVLGIALAQRHGLLDDLNIGLMGWAGQGEG